MHRARERGFAPQEDAAHEALAEVAAAFQESAADVMSAKAVEAVRQTGARGLVLGGGVAANARLRELAQERSPVPVFVPPPVLCTDNGAMVAACAFFHLRRGHTSGLDLDAVPSLRLG